MRHFSILTASLLAFTGVQSVALNLPNKVALLSTPVLALAAPAAADVPSPELSARKDGERRCQSIDPSNCQIDKRDEPEGGSEVEKREPERRCKSANPADCQQD